MPDDPTSIPPPRRRVTRRRVHIIDRVSSLVITLGGMLVVVAVLGIGVYLVSVTAGLFAQGELRTVSAADLGALPGDADILFFDTDEGASVGLRLLADGRLQTIILRTGEVVTEMRLPPPGRIITAFARSPRNNHVALGYDDGEAQLGDIGFSSEFLSQATEPDALRDLAGGEVRIHEGMIAERTPLGQIRLTRTRIELAAPIRLRSGEGAVRLIDEHVGANQQYLLAMREDGMIVLNEVRSRPNLSGGPPRLSLRAHEIVPAEALPEEPPGWTLILGDGSSVLLIWPEGELVRIDISDPESPTIAERLRLVEPGRRIERIAKLIGGKTLVVGDSSGGVGGWFASRNQLSDTPDGLRFLRGHRFAELDGAITSIGVSSRDRTFIVGDSTGRVSVRNMTSEGTLVEMRTETGAPVALAALTPKVDGVIVLDASGRLVMSSLSAPHPDASWRSLFGKVWYEGEAAPGYTYQSSSGDDAAEAKYNLVPLIFGTLKATIYTMLIAIPFGILAAIYTSEFLSPRLRTAIKPSIEMMASLPSVVLGFIAAMILAPMIRDALPGVLLAFVGTPVGVLLGAYLWHFAPAPMMNRCGAAERLAMIVVVSLIAGAVSIAAGPFVERALFAPSEMDILIRAGGYEPAPRESWPDWVMERDRISPADARRLRAQGFAFRNNQIVRPAGSIDDPAIREAVELHGFDHPDLRAWLDGVIGGAWPGWVVIAFPFATIGIAFLRTRMLDPRLREWDRAHSAFVEAGTELFKFFVTLALSVGVAMLLASALAAVGLDPRDSIFGSYQQRNTLVVALAMAIAVIPIIYTIADDAMMSVPDTLRSASLGAGATRWQTAVRVVLPVALSGVFSACMIGLGRAAGETMIVLMATGNTPIMSWSLFDGLRSLSANIAVELPEAPKDSTHYRVLFLCGLALFALTFVVNTAAEVVRQRVRRRSASL